MPEQCSAGVSGIIEYREDLRIMKHIILLSLMFILAASQLGAQNAQLGAGGGLTYILASSAYTDEIDTLGSSFGFKSNYHLALKARFTLPGQPLRLSGSLVYTSFSGTRENFVFPDLVAADLETSLKVYSLVLGAEYLLMPAASPAVPYLGADLLISSFGDRSFTIVRSDRSVERSIGGGARYGLGLGGGIDFTILPQIDLDASLKLNMMNLLGRDEGEKFMSSVNLSIMILYKPL